MELGFATILWIFIGAVEAVLVIARFVMEPSPVRLSIALSIPALLIVGAAINAVYNRLTTGHMLEGPPRRGASRR